MNEINSAFNEYLEVFLANDMNYELEYLKSKEVTELKSGIETEDEFLEAILVYIENAKSVMG